MDGPDGSQPTMMTKIRRDGTEAFASIMTEEQSAVEDKKAGIAWAGSLVGSLNPDNKLGYRYTTTTKRYRLATRVVADGVRELPTNLQVQLRNRQGETLGTLDLPVNSTIDDLTALIHSLSHHDDDGNPETSNVPYSFYAQLQKEHGIDDVEVVSTLADLLQAHTSLSTEQILPIVYQPLAVFRVRPVTRCTATLTGHTEAVLHVQYSPDGRQLASGGGDTTVRFWDVNVSLPKHTCAVHKNHVLCLAWSPNGVHCVSADKNGVLIVWDPVEGKAVRTINAHRQYITNLAWEPLHLNSKCERLATSSKDGTVKIWNIRTGSSLGTLSSHTDSVECVKWSGHGLLYTASRDRTIKVWNPDRGILVKTLSGHGHRVNTLALSSDYVLRTGPFDHKCLKYASPEEAHTRAKERYEVFLEQGAERLVSGSDDYTLFLWHPLESKHPIKRLTGHQQAVNHIQFSPDGRYFASASFDKKVKIWNGHSGDFLTTLTGHVGAVYQVAWSGDSRFLVSASKDSTAKLWNMPSGKRARDTLPGHADEVYALDWSPNGGAVATGSKDRTIKLWKH